MRLVLATLVAKLLELKALSGLLLVLRREVVPILALSALKNDVVTHNFIVQMLDVRCWIPVEASIQHLTSIR